MLYQSSSKRFGYITFIHKKSLSGHIWYSIEWINRDGARGIDLVGQVNILKYKKEYDQLRQEILNHA